MSHPIRTSGTSLSLSDAGPTRLADFAGIDVPSPRSSRQETCGMGFRPRLKQKGYLGSIARVCVETPGAPAPLARERTLVFLLEGVDVGQELLPHLALAGGTGPNGSSA